MFGPAKSFARLFSIPCHFLSILSSSPSQFLFTTRAACSFNPSNRPLPRMMRKQLALAVLAMCLVAQVSSGEKSARLRGCVGQVASEALHPKHEQEKLCFAESKCCDSAVPSHPSLPSPPFPSCPPALQPRPLWMSRPKFRAYGRWLTPRYRESEKLLVSLTFLCVEKMLGACTRASPPTLRTTSLYSLTHPNCRCPPEQAPLQDYCERPPHGWSAHAAC
jgi:hypothetical protein